MPTGRPAACAARIFPPAMRAAKPKVVWSIRIHDQHAGHNPVRQAPVNVHAEHRAEHGPFRNRIGRRFIQTRRIAERSFHQKIEDVNGDSKPKADSKSSRSRRASDAGHRKGRSAIRRRSCQRRPSRVEFRRKARRAAAKPLPPRPAPPGQRPFTADHDQAQSRRQRGAQGGQDQRGRARQRILPRKARAEAADVHPIEGGSRRRRTCGAIREHKKAEEHQASHKCPKRDRQRFE